MHAFLFSGLWPIIMARIYRNIRISALARLTTQYKQHLSSAMDNKSAL